MKLSETTPEQKIKALAELDGWKQIKRRCTCNVDNDGNAHYPCCGLNKTLKRKPRYLTSYDAIIPLIQKQSLDTRQDVYRNLHKEKWEAKSPTGIRFTVDIGDFINYTPSQLADALLVATRKFEL